jgi:hypothetical protein
MAKVIQSRYLPYAEQDVKDHFLKSSKYLKHFLESAGRYDKYMTEHPDPRGERTPDAFSSRQIEKDEQFWTFTCLMKLFHSPRMDVLDAPARPAQFPARSHSPRMDVLEKILRRHVGETPPFRGVTSWGECLEGEMALVFEPALPSPKSYNRWLKKNLLRRQVIPHLIDATYGLGDDDLAKQERLELKGRAPAGSNGRRGGGSAKQQRLEGPTSPDAIITNNEKEFAIVVESKVLSDISCMVKYDAMRNQIARYIDVLLEKGGESSCLRSVRPDRILFVLLTPRMFRDEPTSRFYGRVMREYLDNPTVALARDLRWREGEDWSAVSRRLCWLTWEDFEEELEGSCPWLRSISAGLDRSR